MDLSREANATSPKGLNGFHKRSYPDHTYEGQWKDGKQSGWGTEKLTDDSRYTGQFSNNKKHGKGTEISTYTDEEQYEGEFSEGKRHGSGQLQYLKDGPISDGPFVHGIDMMHNDPEERQLLGEKVEQAKRKRRLTEPESEQTMQGTGIEGPSLNSEAGSGSGSGLGYLALPQTMTIRSLS